MRCSMQCVEGTGCVNVTNRSRVAHCVTDAGRWQHAAVVVVIVLLMCAAGATANRAWAQENRENPPSNGGAPEEQIGSRFGNFARNALDRVLSWERRSSDCILRVTGAIRGLDMRAIRYAVQAKYRQIEAEASRVFHNDANASDRNVDPQNRRPSEPLFPRRQDQQAQQHQTVSGNQSVTQGAHQSNGTPSASNPGLGHAEGQRHGAPVVSVPAVTPRQPGATSQTAGLTFP
jgi:hypothetical protein